MLKISLDSSHDLMLMVGLSFFQISRLHLGPGTRKDSPV